MVVGIWFGMDLLERHLEGSVPGSGPIHDRHFSFGWCTIGENWDESVMLYHADKALFGAWDLDLDGIAQSATYHSHFPIADCGLRICIQRRRVLFSRRSIGSRDGEEEDLGRGTLSPRGDPEGKEIVLIVLVFIPSNVLPSI